MPHFADEGVVLLLDPQLLLTLARPLPLAPADREVDVEQPVAVVIGDGATVAIPDRQCEPRVESEATVSDAQHQRPRGRCRCVVVRRQDEIGLAVVVDVVDAVLAMGVRRAGDACRFGDIPRSQGLRRGCGRRAARIRGPGRPAGRKHDHNREHRESSENAAERSHQAVISWRPSHMAAVKAP
jgi:hypothetical protein